MRAADLLASLDAVCPRRGSLRWKESIAKLPFPLTTIERGLRVRYQNDYSVGLGREFAMERVGPHPKRVVIELTRPGKNGSTESLFKIEGSTPAKLADRAPDEGYSEDEVWAATLEALRERFQRQLRKHIQ